MDFLVDHFNNHKLKTEERSVSDLDNASKYDSYHLKRKDSRKIFDKDLKTLIINSNKKERESLIMLTVSFIIFIVIVLIIYFNVIDPSDGSTKFIFLESSKLFLAIFIIGISKYITYHNNDKNNILIPQLNYFGDKHPALTDVQKEKYLSIKKE
jgi:hypothetical protein